MDKKIKEDDMERTFNHCLFCGNVNVERYRPLGQLGIYSRCPLCGAAAGLARYTSGRDAGRLYLYWVAREGAKYREEQDKQLREQELRRQELRGGVSIS